MGMVWLAEDEQLREQVALKFLSPKIGLNIQALEDLKRETARARKLTHPNIVRIHDFFKGEHEAFISMEFVDGAHLGALRLAQPDEVFAWNDLLPFVIQLCDALDYAHNEGVIHRDIKPGNLMVDGKGRLKLTDFGLSARLANLPDDLPDRNARSGTIAYMSPEQLAGDTPNVKDDIYALGATLYELLTGQPPFFAGAMIRNSRSLPIAEQLAECNIQNRIPASVNALIIACLAKDPLKRPASARLISESLTAPEPSPNTAAANPDANGVTPDKSTTSTAQTIGCESVDLPIVPPVENWPDSDIRPGRPQSTTGVWVAVVVFFVLVGAGAFAWIRSHKGMAAETSAETNATGDPDMEAVPQAASDASGNQTPPPSPQPASRPASVTHETADFVISGTDFVVQNFNEGTRTYSNRDYVWRQVPVKFRGWNFTQINVGKPARIHVRAKRSTFLFIAAAANPSGVELPGWEPDRSAFTNDKGQLRMIVFRKAIEAGQDIEIPQNGRSTVILIFPK